MNAIEELNKACSIAEKSAMGMLKSHIKQYTRQDGTVVQEHEDNRVVHHKPTGKTHASERFNQKEKNVRDLHAGKAEDGVHHGDVVEHLGNDKAFMLHNGHYVSGSKKAVFEASKKSQEMSRRGTSHLSDYDQRHIINQYVKKTTGEDVKFTPRSQNYDKQKQQFSDLLKKD